MRGGSLEPKSLEFPGQFLLCRSRKQKSFDVKVVNLALVQKNEGFIKVIYDGTTFGVEGCIN